MHRDIKPTNIMITDAPPTNRAALADEPHTGENVPLDALKTGATISQYTVKVLDFGVAKLLPVEGQTYFKLTQTGETLGSLLYMSPEQCLDQDVDARSDVYSLGCLLYEALTGKPPLCGRTAFETMNKHLNSMPQRLSKVRPNLQVPDRLERIIFTAVAKKPKDRYQTISDFQQQLSELGRDTVSPRKRQNKQPRSLSKSPDEWNLVPSMSEIWSECSFVLRFYLVTAIVIFGISLPISYGAYGALIFALLVPSPILGYLLWYLTKTVFSLMLQHHNRST